MNRRDYEKAIEAEVERWPGVTVEFAEGGKHPKAKLKFEGRILARPFAGTPSDATFGIHRMLGDMRRVMKQLGAERDRPEPTAEEDEAPYRKPNEGRAKRPDPVEREPAPVQPDLADQMVDAGLATEKQASRARQTVVVPDEDETVEEAERAARLEELQQRIDAIEDGIYFGLEPEVYHAVPALGSGSICDLLVSPGTFWRGSWLDPERPEFDEDSTKAQILGQAYHCARLEPERLEQLFCPELDKTTMPPRSLFTGPQMAAELVERGLPKSGSVLEQAERLADDGFPVDRLWHVALANWKRELGDRQPIPAKYWNEIVTDMERIRRTPEIAALLEGGAAEVSVFWTDEQGHRLKARFDYLRPNQWVDFKTYDNSRRKAVAQAIADAVRYNRYYVQAVHYRHAHEMIRAGALEIVGDATDAQRLLVGEIQRGGPAECWYIFQEKSGVPNLYAKRFYFNALDRYREHEIKAMLDDPAQQVLVRDAMASKTQICRRGEIEIGRAKELFHVYSQVYAPGEPWAPLDPIGAITDEDFSNFWLEGKS